MTVLDLSRLKGISHHAIRVGLSLRLLSMASCPFLRILDTHEAEPKRMIGLLKSAGFSKWRGTKVPL